MLADQLLAEYENRFTVKREYLSVLKFDPGQARDAQGRWAEENSASLVESLKPEHVKQLGAVIDKLSETFGYDWMTALVKLTKEGAIPLVLSGELDLNKLVKTPAFAAILKFDPAQPREPAGSPKGGEFAKTTRGFDPAKKETWYRFTDDWHQNPDGGGQPYGWGVDDPSYVPPKVVHSVVRGPNYAIWGGSHHGSSVITGDAAKQMGLEGWKDLGATKEAADVATRMLTAIAEDEVGSEEPLYHGFENTRKTVFREGDTLSLPLVAASGKPNASYGIRMEWENQQGAPTVFAFPKGTPMAGYSTATKRTAADLGLRTVEEVHKEFGYVWEEAIVAGKFRVGKIETVYMGSQHSEKPIGKDQTPQLYGQVVHLEPLAKFNPKTGKWVERG